jgi:anti-sigma B factor antagonist
LGIDASGFSWYLLGQMAAISKVESDVVTISGEIDMHESPRLKQTFEPLITRKTGRVLVDFSGVSYIDSSGLAVFIEAMQRIQGYGGIFALYGLRENVRNIFELSRLDQIFRIYPDKSAALNAA